MNLLIFMVLLTADISSAGIIVDKTNQSSFTFNMSVTDMEKKVISIVENYRNLQCTWGSTPCYVDCIFVNVTTNVSSLQGWDIINPQGNELAFNASDGHTICNVTLCEKEAIRNQADKLCGQNSDASHVKKLQTIKQMCGHLFTGKDSILDEYISWEKRCLNIIINMPFAGETKTYDMGHLVMTVVKMDKMNATNHGYVNIPPLEGFDSEMPLDVQIPMEPFLNVSENQSKVAVVMYSSEDQFETDQSSLNIMSKVIRVEVPEREINGLSNQLVINFTLDSNEGILENHTLSCQFYDEKVSKWSTTGSNTNVTNNNTIQCSYNHMTPFAVLLVDLSQIDKQQWTALSYISYIGCGLSLFFSAASILIYIFSRKKKEDHSTVIHISLSAVLCLLNASFLLSEWAATLSQENLCVFIAVVMQYSLLSSFSWMAIEAMHIYLLLVKVFSTYIKHYMIKLSLFGWGFPAILVAASLCVYKNKPFYGTKVITFANAQGQAKICWITEPRFLYGMNITYFSCTFVFNTAIFVVVAYQIFRLRGTHDKRPSCKHICSVLGMTCLLGITWGLAFLSSGYINYPILYLFCICNTLQGLFLFLWICGTTRKNRPQAMERSTMPVQPSFAIKPAESNITRL